MTLIMQLTIFKITMLFYFIFLSHQVNASDSNYNDSKVWGQYKISEPIEPSGENKSIEALDNTFKNRTVSIDRTNVIISDLCNYKFAKEAMTPITYWNSEGAVSIYKKLLIKYNVGAFEKLDLYTPEDPTESCPYPFSYFIKINDRLIFTKNNRLKIFSLGTNNLADNECVHKKQTAEEVYENGDVTICKYKNSNVIDAYRKYILESQNINADNFVAKVVPNKDAINKCKRGCLETSYKWKGAQKLIINPSFEGGETIVSFEKTDDGLLVQEKLFSD